MRETVIWKPFDNSHRAIIKEKYEKERFFFSEMEIGKASRNRVSKKDKQIPKTKNWSLLPKKMRFSRNTILKRNIELLFLRESDYK